MTDNKKRFTSLLLSLFLSPLLLAGAYAGGDEGAALVSLTGPAGYANFVEALPAVAVPVPAVVDLKEAGSGAPKPGRDLTPLMQDPARVKAIIKLVADIYNGVSLPYSQDGSVFKNREGILPQQPYGYYHEYTLLTGDAPHVVVIDGTTYQVAPDLSSRGSERIIIGGGEKIYYTPDHYANFIEFMMVY